MQLVIGIRTKPGEQYPHVRTILPAEHAHITAIPTRQRISFWLILGNCLPWFMTLRQSTLVNTTTDNFNEELLAHARGEPQFEPDND